MDPGRFLLKSLSNRGPKRHCLFTFTQPDHFCHTLPKGSNICFVSCFNLIDIIFFRFIVRIQNFFRYLKMNIRTEYLKISILNPHTPSKIYRTKSTRNLEPFYLWTTNFIFLWFKRASFKIGSDRIMSTLLLATRALLFWSTSHWSRMKPSRSKSPKFKVVLRVKWHE